MQQDIAPTDNGADSLVKIEANFTELYGKTDKITNASASAPASIDLAEDTDNGTNKITVTAPSAVASDKVLTLPDETGNVLSSVSTLAGINKTPLFAPRGFLINGKFTVTDTGSGVSVAIKGLDGNDPSATNPVYCRIGDTVRSIESDRSYTLADGSNWFNAGSVELRTKEIDYFVYLVWDSNSSEVNVTFARIPYANLISSFSNTTTDERYCAGYGAFTATDEVENIGRFAATLSAGAGYTWSVPTFTVDNLIQRPIFETRWLNWQPQYGSSGSMTFTSVTLSLAHYKIIGESCVLGLDAVGTTGGTATIALTYTLPFSYFSAGTSETTSGSALDANSVSGQVLFVGPTSRDYLSVRRYDSANYGLGTIRGARISGAMYRIRPASA